MKPILPVIAVAFAIITYAAELTMWGPDVTSIGEPAMTNTSGVVTIRLTADQHLYFAKDNGELTNLVNLLVTSGEFCRVRGHVWHYGGKVEDHFYGLTFEDAFKNARKCAVCGKVESRTVHSWPSETAQVTILTNIVITNMVVTNITVLTNLFQYYNGGTNNYIPLNDFVERRDLPH